MKKTTANCGRLRKFEKEKGGGDKEKGLADSVRVVS